MDEQGSTKFIDPRIQEVQNTTTNIYNKAMDEFGFKMPLAFALYNQIRYYEDFGKLKIGYSIVGKEALANQFGVTVKQIEKAYDNLTNKYKLGNWVINDKPIFRNVTKVWASNIRQRRMSLEDTLKLIENSYGVGVNGQKLLQCRSKTPTVEELTTGVRPLSESNKKVNNNISKKTQSLNKIIPKDLLDASLRAQLKIDDNPMDKETRESLLRGLPFTPTPDQLIWAAEDYVEGGWNNKSFSHFMKPSVFVRCVDKYLFKGEDSCND